MSLACRLRARQRLRNSSRAQQRKRLSTLPHSCCSLRELKSAISSRPLCWGPPANVVLRGSTYIHKISVTFCHANVASSCPHTAHQMFSDLVLSKLACYSAASRRNRNHIASSRFILMMYRPVDPYGFRFCAPGRNAEEDEQPQRWCHVCSGVMLVLGAKLPVKR